MKEAGDLLAVEAIDRTGLAVTSEGAFVRVLNVTPPNPLILSPEERVRIAHGYCHLLSRLRADQSLQFYVNRGRSTWMKFSRALAVKCDTRRATPPERRSMETAWIRSRVSRWRLYAAMEESLRLHADEQAAVQTSFYVVCPYLPVRGQRHELIREMRTRRGKLPTAPLRRACGRTGGPPGKAWRSRKGCVPSSMLSRSRAGC